MPSSQILLLLQTTFFFLFLGMDFVDYCSLMLLLCIASVFGRKESICTLDGIFFEAKVLLELGGLGCKYLISLLPDSLVVAGFSVLFVFPPWSCERELCSCTSRRKQEVETNALGHGSDLFSLNLRSARGRNRGSGHRSLCVGPWASEHPPGNHSLGETQPVSTRPGARCPMPPPVFHLFRQPHFLPPLLFSVSYTCLPPSS